MSFKNPNIYRNTHSPIPFRLKKVKRTREREKEKRSIFTENSLQRYRFISPIVRFPWRHGSQRGDTRSNRTQTTPFPPSLSIYTHTHFPPLVQRRNRHERGERRCGPNWISTKSRYASRSVLQTLLQLTFQIFVAWALACAVDRVSWMRVTSTPGRCILAGQALKGDTLCRLASLSAGYPLKRERERETFDLFLPLCPSSIHFAKLPRWSSLRKRNVESKRRQRIIDVEPG